MSGSALVIFSVGHTAVDDLTAAAAGGDDDDDDDDVFQPVVLSGIAVDRRLVTADDDDHGGDDVVAVVVVDVVVVGDGTGDDEVVVVLVVVVVVVVVVVDDDDDVGGVVVVDVEDAADVVVVVELVGLVVGDWLGVCAGETDDEGPPSELRQVWQHVSLLSVARRQSSLVQPTERSPYSQPADHSHGCAKFGANPFMGVGLLGKWVKYNRIFFYLFIPILVNSYKSDPSTDFHA